MAPLNKKKKHLKQLLEAKKKNKSISKSKAKESTATKSKKKVKKSGATLFSRCMKANKESLYLKRDKRLNNLKDILKRARKAQQIKRKQRFALESRNLASTSFVEPRTPASTSSVEPRTPASTSSVEPRTPASTSFVEPQTLNSEQEVNVSFTPRKNIKLMKKRGYFHRIKKLREIGYKMLGNGVNVNPPNTRQKLSLAQQAELLFSKKLTSRQIDCMSKLTGKCHSYKNLMKKLQPILEKFPITKTDDGKLHISLIQSLKVRLNNMLHQLPRKRRIQITIVADKGEKITKICYFFNGVDKPQSTENLGVLCFYIGDDDSDSIRTSCESINDEIRILLKNGLKINGKVCLFEIFITGDCKSICSMLGVQGGSAVKFCHHCLTTDYCIQGVRRTTIGTRIDAKSIEDEINGRALSDPKIRAIKKKFNSISHKPIFTTIDNFHVVPPALHLLMALTNKLIDYFKNSRLSQIIKDLKVEPIQGRGEYNGNGCRKILQYFCRNAPLSTNELQMFHLFKQAAKVQSFAIANTLTLNDIQECKDAIKRLFDDLDGLSNFKFTNKLHILRFHVIPFIKTFKSWGNYSEQGIERLHCLVNVYRKRIQSKKEDKRNIYAIKMLILGTYFSDQK